MRWRAGTELDYETKDTYEVTLTAEDSFGASDTIMVTITVTDMDEAPEIMRAPDENIAPEFASATITRTVAENTAAGEDIGNPVAANDANGDALTYVLGGTDAASFDIDADTGQLMTLTALDHETKDSYSVTVTASDSGGLSDSIDVTITVTNVDEPGKVTLSSMQTVVGAALTASVEDPDGVVTVETWQWAKSLSMDGSFTDIDMATLMAYTPVEADEDYYLRATASYTDGHGSGKTKSMETTASVVTATAADPLLAEYDDNNNGMIDKDRSHHGHQRLPRLGIWFYQQG